MLDWTITEDDTPDAPSPAMPPRRSQPSWALFFIALAVAGALAIWGLTARETLERDARVADLLARHPLEAPLPALTPRGAPVIESTTVGADGTWSITAVYAYTGVDGTPLRFRAERGFSPTGDPAPQPVAITRTIDAQHIRLVIEAGATDAETALLAGEIARVSAEACAQWACPADLQLTIDLTTPATRHGALRPDPIAPTNRVFAYAQTFVVVGDTLAVPRPLTAGVPVDEATSTYWRRAIADAMLVQLGLLVRDHVQPGFFAPPLTHNAFFYGLVLRQAVRSGVEDPTWLTARSPEPVGQDAAALWRTQTAIDHSPPADGAELHAALALLNAVVGDDLQFEQRLFATLNPERQLANWLAEAAATTGRSAEQTLQQLNIPTTANVLAELASGSAWSALLTCNDGQWIWSPTGRRVPPGFTDDVLAQVRIVGARPTINGLDLALTIGGRLAIRSARTGAITWTAGARVPSAMNFAGWIGANAAYYWSAPDQDGTIIELVSPIDPGTVLARIDDAYRLVPAPVGDVAFVVSTALSEWSLLDGSGLVRMVMPLNGLDIPFAVGYPPTWAPEGQRAAVLLTPSAEAAWGGGSAVGILPAVTTPDFAIEVWSPLRVGLTVAPGPTAGEVLWSPSGDRLAVAAPYGSGDSDGRAYGLWLLTPVGSSVAEQAPIRLDLPVDASVITDLGFSADGRTLTATSWRLGAPTVHGFAAEDGAPLFEQPGAARVSWAPVGPGAIALGPGGAAYRDRPDVSPTTITESSCSGVIWNPNLPR